MIKDLSSKGNSAYAIGKELFISKNTAKKYIEKSVQIHGLKGLKKGSKLDPYKSHLKTWMSQGMFNCAVLLERLKELGYTGGRTILKDYVHPYRPIKHAPAVRRYETANGQQAQMDWGICTYLDKSGSIHKVPAFVMILGMSRVKYIEFVKRCDLRSMERCIINAFTYFGGIPKEILTDNMKTVVVGRENGRIIWNTKFAEFASDMGFTPKVCKIRRPQTKGKVERLVRYVKDNFFPGRTFSDLEDLNLQALNWCKKADSKIHGTTGRIPLMDLEKEQLSKLPEMEILNRYRWETRTVTRDGFVSFDGVMYGVPWQYSGKEVHIRLHGKDVEIYDGDVIISKHHIKYISGRSYLIPNQYKGLAERHGIAFPPAFARQKDICVETRKLEFYDKLLGEYTYD